MSRLILSNELLLRLRKELFQSEKETCAILFGRSVEVSGRLARIVIHEAFHPNNNQYEIRTSTRAQLEPEYVAEVTQRVRTSGESLVFVHTHPFNLNQYSEIDDVGEEELKKFLEQRAPNARHASMLLTPEVSIARELGHNRPLRVAGIGREIIWGDTILKENSNEIYDRQVRIFGREGQEILGTIRVGIVGLGGTGSIVLEQLTHLGVHNFVLIDPDIIENTNLNRVVGAVPSDIGRPKVAVAKSWAERINPSIIIEARQESVLKADVIRSLADMDIILCCTDSHGSRAILNQFAYQYFVPVIDMGVVITMEQNRVANIAGRTQLLGPGMACMVCGNLLDPEQIRRDLLSDFERKVDPYIIGHPEPAPAVISLNGTIASLATTMFLNVVLGIPDYARFINYDGISGITRPAFCNAHPSCVVCSHNGALARCDEWLIPARRE